MTRALLAACLLLGPAAASGAASLHDATNWTLVVPAANLERVESSLDLELRSVDGQALRLDAWFLPRSTGEALRPAVVFLGGPSDPSSGPMRRKPLFQSWMRTVAAHGFVALMADVAPRSVEASHAALFRFLAEHGAELGVDASRTAVVALSTNVASGLPFVMSDSAPSGVRAAVFLYGAATTNRIRADLPVLFVVAGRDAPGVLDASDALLAIATSSNAPWIFVHALAEPHAFDVLDPGANGRALVRQALDFLDEQLAPPPAAIPEPAKSARAGLAALYGRNFVLARSIYEEISKGPDASDPLVWKNLAWACEGSGDAQAALKALDRALALDPDDPASLRAAGFAAARLSSWERADAALTRLGARADASALEALGLARMRLGRPADALAPLSAAASQTGNPTTRYNYACALALAGDREGAIRELSRAILEGYQGPDLAADPDLESLRSDPRFRELAARTPRPSDEGSSPLEPPI